MQERLVRWLAAVLACAACAGCRLPQPSAYPVRFRATGAAPNDVTQSEIYRRMLPTILQLPPNQLRVEPGPGTTYVYVTGVAAPAAVQALISDVLVFNEDHPFNPLELRLQ